MEEIAKVNSSENNSSTSWCVQLPIYKGNHTFCGLTSFWKPRLSEEIYSLYTYLFPSFGSLFIICELAFLILCKSRLRIFQTKIKRISSCIVLFQILWDFVDFLVDLKLLKQLEFGDLISIQITRNIKVNNAIFAFALLGFFKSFLWFWIFTVADVKENPVRYFEQIKHMIAVFSFTFEDGPEIILEYFYIEKYFTNLVWYVIVRDGIIVLILLVSFGFLVKDCCLESNLNYSCTEHGTEHDTDHGTELGTVHSIEPDTEHSTEHDTDHGTELDAIHSIEPDTEHGTEHDTDHGTELDTVHSIEPDTEHGTEHGTELNTNGYQKRFYIFVCFVLFISLVIKALRVGGALYQYVTGRLYRSCFDVIDGKLIQTPFASGCLREVDYAILVFCCAWAFVFIPALYYGFFYTCKTTVKIYK